MGGEPKRTGFIIDTEKCTECQRCMVECSLVKTNKVVLSAARITIKKSWPKTPEFKVCRFDDCQDKPCIDACPVEAITDENGLILIDAEACTGCEACVEVCPFGAIVMSAESVAVKCDFCGGDPACVKECATEALTRMGN